MTKVTILNRDKVQKAIKGTDEKIYYIPAKAKRSLPAGVEILEGRDQYIKVTVSES